MSELLSFILSQEDAFKSQARLTSLYSDFAIVKHSNPDGFAANTSAWRSALENACRAGLTPAPSLVQDAEKKEASTTSSNARSSLVFRTGDELVKQLETRELGRPLALGDVVNDTVAKGSIFPLHHYLTSKTAISTATKASWIPTITLPTPYDVARWLLYQVGFSKSTSTGLASGDFVVLKNVEEASTAVLNHIATHSPTSTSLIYSLQTLTATFAHILPDAPPLSSLDITILLTHLSRDTHAVSLSRPAYQPAHPDDPLVIKFNPPNTTTPTPITHQDTTIASLNTLSHTLTQQANLLTTRLADLDTTLHSLLPSAASSASTKSRALAVLRQKKTLQATLQRRLDAQSQVDATLTAIDDAVTNVQLTHAMDASASVLRELNKQVGGAEGVEKVMGDLAEARAESEEVAGVLRGDGEGVVDEGEVEAELEALVGEKEGENEEGKELELPSVPEMEPEGGSVEERSTGELEKRLSAVSLEEEEEPRRMEEDKGSAETQTAE